MRHGGRDWTWVGTASGTLFVVAQFAGFGIGAAARGFERITLTTPSPDVAQALAARVPPAVWIGGYAEVVAYLFFLVFTACLAAELRAQHAEPAWPSFTALSAGVLVVATSMIGYATEGAAYLRAGDGIDPSVARALLDVANLAFVLVWSALGAFLLAVAAARVLPRWLGIAAAILGLTFLAGSAAPLAPIGEIADLALWAWIIAVSVALARREKTPRTHPAPVTRFLSGRTG